VTLGGRAAPLLDRIHRSADTAEPAKEPDPEDVEHAGDDPAEHLSHKDTAGMRVETAIRLRLRRWLIRGMSKAHLALQRLSRGRAFGRVAGMPVLLLTTTGRRSGKARTTPLTFFRDGDDLAVVGSNGGADRPPDWSLNLETNPRAIVAIGRDTFGVTARTASDEERSRLWTVITATYSGYARYENKTARRIPVVILTPDDAEAARPAALP
jgi:deazaflavin-dependent oxidoreductase (nitroreductase family)